MQEIFFDFFQNFLQTIPMRENVAKQNVTTESRPDTNQGWRWRARKPFNFQSKIGEPLRGVQTGRSPCAAISVRFCKKSLPYTTERPGERCKPFDQ